MRVALLAEGVRSDAPSGRPTWCDRLVRGMPGHDFENYVLTRTAAEQRHCAALLDPRARPPRIQPLWGAPIGRPKAVRGRAARQALECYRELSAAIAATAAGSGFGHGSGIRARPRAGTCGGTEPSAERTSAAQAEADRFASGLYGLAELARDGLPLPALLRTEAALRILQDTCRPCAPAVGDLLAVADLLERALRPLSAPWYREGRPGLAHADLCHATAGGLAALPGLLAGHFFGTPLLVTEHGAALRDHLLAQAHSALPRPVRLLTSGLYRLLARETYRKAALVTADHAHTRRWQERCGADRDLLRTVHPGTAPAPFTEVPDATAPDGRPATVLWTGVIGPGKDLDYLLYAFSEVHGRFPATRLRIVGTVLTGPGEDHLAHCRDLAGRLFPEGLRGVSTDSTPPVVFETTGGAEALSVAEACAAADLVVSSGSAEGFPQPLVEAMLCGRATVSTDVGAVREVVGGTGLVVPPRNPRALAAACLALLEEPERIPRLGAAARSRALELFADEQVVTAFHGIYLELVSHAPVPGRQAAAGAAGLPFAHPAESHLPGRWAVAGSRRPTGPVGLPRALPGPFPLPQERVSASTGGGLR